MRVSLFRFEGEGVFFCVGFTPDLSGGRPGTSEIHAHLDPCKEWKSYTVESWRK